MNTTQSTQQVADQQAPTAMRIKIAGPMWNQDAANLVASVCRKYALPFVDRAGVASVFENAGFDTIAHLEGTPLPDSYVFFTHRNMADLPCTHQVTVPEKQLPPEEQKPSRKIETGSKRVRKEWKDARDFCKKAESFFEWASRLYDLMCIPKYSVATVTDKGTTWTRSSEKDDFVYPTNTLDCMPKSMVSSLEGYLTNFRCGRDPVVLTNTKSERYVLIQPVTERSPDDPKEVIVGLSIKPVSVQSSLY